MAVWKPEMTVGVSNIFKNKNLSSKGSLGTSRSKMVLVKHKERRTFTDYRRRPLREKHLSLPGALPKGQQCQGSVVELDSHKVKSWRPWSTFLCLSTALM
jgi:hypothetical protein